MKTTLYWCDQVLLAENERAASATDERKLTAVEARVASPTPMQAVLAHAITQSMETRAAGGTLWPRSIQRPTGRYTLDETGDSVAARCARVSATLAASAIRTTAIAVRPPSANQ
jgi:hypothetical protein